MFAAAAFRRYEAQQVLIDSLQAVNITSILGDKGSTAYHCPDSATGTNVISVTFAPGYGMFYAAWENQSGAAWRPAACNTYVQFNMTAWW